MLIQIKYSKIALLTIIVMVFSNSYLNAQIRMASGISSEIYTQFAKDIQNNTDVDIKYYTTMGSNENLNLLMSDSIDIAFMQYDVLIYKELENPGIKNNLQVFLPLYNEEVHLITINNHNINSLEDLEGKHVGIGSKRSGTSITANIIKDKTGIQWIDHQIPFDSAFSKLLHHKIDAFFFVGASPSNLLKSFSQEARNLIKLVPIESKKLNNLYRKKEIKSSTYSWMTGDIKTIGVQSLLVVNTNNITKEKEKEIEYFYNDLRNNLTGIQKNKLSHAKWQQVDFSNRKNINWTVYKKEFKNTKTVSNIMGLLAAIFTFIQIYFMINKLWIRKGDKSVAESISISALFISLLINSFFVFGNLISGSFQQAAANIMWISASVIMMFIGVGYWVSSKRHQGFWSLLKQALKLEKQEAGDLAKSFFRPTSAEKIIEILGQMAMIDNEVNEKEKKFIQPFADAWGITIDWNYIEHNFGPKNGMGFYTLRKSMKEYLATSPPEKQVSQLNNLLVLLVEADNVVTKEEELILEELTGMIEQYLGSNSNTPKYNVAVVPQNKEYETAIHTIIQSLNKTEIAGGYAYLSEPYYSEKYAEIICERFRMFNIFTVVIKPDYIQDTQDVFKNIDTLTDEEKSAQILNEFNDIFTSQVRKSSTLMDLE